MLVALLLFVTTTLKVPDAAQFVGAPQGMPVADVQLASRTHEVASLLRCPVCQGMSVADSPSEMAINMKEQVRELLARGYTEEQILKYFELSYGQFVLLRPKFEGVNALVWLLPIFAVIIGVTIVLLKIRKLERPLPASANTADEAAAIDDPYVSRVRELVRGDKQG
jgi:cytochrome c-type biogenesis protein CcmH